MEGKAVDKRVVSVPRAILFLDIVPPKEFAQSDLENIANEIIPELYSKTQKIHETRSKDGFDKTECELHTNAWGNTIVLFSASAYVMGFIALGIQGFFNEYEVPILAELKLKTQISIHYGKINQFYDPFRAKRGYFGWDIVTSARIKPVVKPGAIWTTGKFKREVEELYRKKPRKNGKLDFSDESIELDLHKNYGKLAVWEMKIEDNQNA